MEQKRTKWQNTNGKKLQANKKNNRSDSKSKIRQELSAFIGFVDEIPADLLRERTEPSINGGKAAAAALHNSWRIGECAMFTIDALTATPHYHF